MSSERLADFVAATIRQMVAEAGTTTAYREPLVGFAAADDARFSGLRQVANPNHMLPEDLLSGAHSVISYYLPFAPDVVRANEWHREQVATEWAVAYVETNALIGQINSRLIEALAERGIRAAAEPATHNYDPATLKSAWSHKSVAVIAGLGSFGLHQMVITDAGCAGRFGSIVIDAHLPKAEAPAKERCLYFHDGSCLECVARCPVSALAEVEPLDRQRCNQRLERLRKEFSHLGRASACGKCAIGPCSFQSAVQ